MSGPIVDDAIRICTVCGAAYLEDPVLLEDPDICPVCGSPTDAESVRGEGVMDDFDYFGSGGSSPEPSPRIVYAEAGDAEAGDPTSEVVY